MGPTLFLCFINDFWTATSLFSALFTDDTTCLGKGKKLSELTAYVKQELQKFANCFRSNKMAVNTAKTKFLVFRTQGKPINPRECRLLFNSKEIGNPEDLALIYEIESVHNEGQLKSFKLLGILLDEYLCFDEHINSFCATISKSLFCINRVKNFINRETKKTLYFAMVHSH